MKISKKLLETIILEELSLSQKEETIIQEKEGGRKDLSSTERAKNHRFYDLFMKKTKEFGVDNKFEVAQLVSALIQDFFESEPELGKQFKGKINAFLTLVRRDIKGDQAADKSKAEPGSTKDDGKEKELDDLEKLMKDM